MRVGECYRCGQGHFSDHYGAAQCTQCGILKETPGSRTSSEDCLFSTWQLVVVIVLPIVLSVAMSAAVAWFFIRGRAYLFTKDFGHCSTIRRKRYKVTEGVSGTVYKVMWQEDPLKYAAIKIIRTHRSAQEYTKLLEEEVGKLAAAVVSGEGRLAELITEEGNNWRDSLKRVLRLGDRLRLGDCFAFGRWSIGYYPAVAIVMEYIEGEKLSSLLADSNNILEPVRITHISQGILQGLKAMHCAGFAHGDVKPCNVIVEKVTLDVKLVDFGLDQGKCQESLLHGKFRDVRGAAVIILAMNTQTYDDRQKLLGKDQESLEKEIQKFRDITTELEVAGLRRFLQMGLAPEPASNRFSDASQMLTEFEGICSREIAHNNGRPFSAREEASLQSSYHGSSRVMKVPDDAPIVISNKPQRPTNSRSSSPLFHLQEEPKQEQAACILPQSQQAAGSQTAAFPQTAASTIGERTGSDSSSSLQPGTGSNLSCQSTAQNTQRVSRATLAVGKELVPCVPGYEILLELGKGAQGSVFLATTSWGSDGARHVAIKVCKNWKDSSREVVNLQSIKHPNVVEFKAGPIMLERERAAIVMEYVDGQTLNVWAKAIDGRLGSAKVALHILEGLLSGLDALHTNGIVHRDVKPNNVMVAGHRVVLVDFGIAKRHKVGQTLTGEGETPGTVAYLPPEVIRCEVRLDCRVDVWACGVVLFELLMKRRPFENVNLLALIEAIKSCDVPPLDQNFGAGVCALVERALSKPTENRFASAGVMLHWLKEVKQETSKVPDFSGMRSEAQSGFEPSVRERAYVACNLPQTSPAARTSSTSLAGTSSPTSEASGVMSRVISGSSTPMEVQQKWKVIFFSCRCGTTIDPETECQQFKNLLRKNKSFTFEAHARPEIANFTDELRHESNCDEKQRLILHFSGHASSSTGGLYWFLKAGGKVKENQVTGDCLADIIKHNKQHGVVEKIDCFFLNACSTLETGLALCRIGVKVVICWQTTIKQRISCNFAVRFYEILRDSPGDYLSAFASVCNEEAQQLSLVCPCILHSGEPGKVGSVQVWSGSEKKMVSLNDDQVVSFLQVALALQVSGSSEEELDEKLAGGNDSDDDNSEADPEKNWKSPNSLFDFAAHAGLAEQSLLSILGFDMSKIVTNKSGMVTSASLKAMGVGSYRDLWGSYGKIVKKAKEMLTSSQLQIAMKRNRIETAISALRTCIYYRQMDVLFHRMKKSQTSSKKKWPNFKEKLLKKPKEEIMQTFYHDVRDRNILEQGGNLSDIRKQELEGACQSHLFELDCRSETCDALKHVLYESVDTLEAQVQVLSRK